MEGGDSGNSRDNASLEIIRHMEQSRVQKIVFFDFDGTLADTIRIGADTYNELAEKHGFKKIGPENVAYLRQGDPRRAMKELNISFFKLPLILQKLRAGVEAKIANLTVFTGMKPILVSLKKNGYRLGVFSSNSTKTINHFLEQNRLSGLFDYVHAGSGIFGKTLGFQKIVRRYGSQNSQFIFVGDEIRDVEAARKSGATSIAVTWGINSKEGLMRAHPDFIVDAPEELTKILLG